MKQDANKPLLFMGIPTRGMHSHYFSQMLAGTIFPSNFSLVQFYIPYMEVGRARNLIVHKAIEAKAKYLVFLDEDVIGPPNGMKTLLFHMENHPDWTFCSGLYATKSYPPEPLLYTEWGQGSNYDWQVGDLKKVLFTGMGYSMIRVSDLALLDPITYDDHDPQTTAPIKVKEFFKTGDEQMVVAGNTIKTGHTEDAHFFKQLEEKGLTAMIDTAILCSHFDDKQLLFFNVPTKGKPDAWNATPRILDVGAGNAYDPYVVTVDLLDAPNITVKCDVRKLPEDWADQFDEVRASHVLEHIDFGQTQETLNEWARVVKPGGKLRIIVPDLEAYAERILNGEDGKPGYMDTFILGGFYGDQGHPYWRQEPFGGEHDGRFIKDSFLNNHHRTGFTSRSLAGHMAAAGLEIVTLERREYQVLCEGKKPGGETDAEESNTTDTSTDAAPVQVFSEPVAPVDDVIDA
jgi:SAM-dependent methyltransferase